MTHDPVTAALITHLVEADHAEAEAAEINRRVNEYLTTIHGRNTIAGDAEVMARMDELFACICASKTECSIKVAVNEVHTASVLAATRHAVDDLREERKEAQAEARERREEAREYERMAVM